ncbi:MAG: DNA gyrase subunit A, partial [Oscillospiraceae bacterium]
DLSGLKITIDMKRGVDGDKLMQKLMRCTPLEDSFSCNFNILTGEIPKVLGVREILNEWSAFRFECIRRKTSFDLGKKQEKLHLLKGLAKILLDIDKAVKIVRETTEEKEVIPNLMIGFGIDEIQANFVAEIKLRQLNKEYILKRISEVSDLEAEIADLNEVLSSKSRIAKIIVTELREVIKNYSKPRQTLILEDFETLDGDDIDDIPNYPVNYIFSAEGYFKKITPQSLRMSNVQKLKEGDEVAQQIEGENTNHLLFFTDKGQVYKTAGNDFDDTKASVLGEYLPARLGMDESEQIIYMAVTADYSGYMLFIFASGKVAKVDMKTYETKTKRR